MHLSDMICRGLSILLRGWKECGFSLLNLGVPKKRIFRFGEMQVNWVWLSGHRKCLQRSSAIQYSMLMDPSMSSLMRPSPFSQLYFLFGSLPQVGCDFYRFL